MVIHGFLMMSAMHSQTRLLSLPGCRVVDAAVRHMDKDKRLHVLRTAFAKSRDEDTSGSSSSTQAGSSGSSAGAPAEGALTSGSVTGSAAESAEAGSTVLGAQARSEMPGASGISSSSPAEAGTGAGAAAPTPWQQPAPQREPQPQSPLEQAGEAAVGAGLQPDGAQAGGVAVGAETQLEGLVDVSQLPAGVGPDALLTAVTQLIEDMEEQQVVADRCGAGAAHRAVGGQGPSSRLDMAAWQVVATCHWQAGSGRGAGPGRGDGNRVAGDPGQCRWHP